MTIEDQKKSEEEVVAGKSEIDSTESAVLTQKEAASSEVKKKKKKKKKKKSKKPLEIGSSKAVDTMFRNAYRAELDIISLAATKVNIMISLNGFIISALVISGALVFSSSPEFLIPAGVFLVTATLSIVFALLAASPEYSGLLPAFFAWSKALFRREARLGDFSKYLKPEKSPKAEEEVNLLIYSDRSSFSKEEYWQRMEKFLRDDRDEIYKKMSDQLYWLGLMANRKFNLLNVSYTVFRWGVLASAVTFLTVKALLGVFPKLSGEEGDPFYGLSISEMDGIYEPSAVQQLDDGRILVVEDEASRAISVMTLADDGSLVGNDALDLRLMRSFGSQLSDLEGLSIDENGFIYAITSHSKNKDGERVPAREQLLRFRIEGNRVTEISRYGSLVDDLQNSNQLQSAIADETEKNFDFDNLNIEGMTYYQKAGQLMLGLRSPKARGDAVIITIKNPAEVFEREVSPQFGTPILLDLKGEGIRALSYDPVLGLFLIVNEIENSQEDKVSQLWTWSGNVEDKPEEMMLPGLINLNNVESVDSISFRGKPRLLISSDEGNKKKKRPAKYMLLNYDQLSR